MSKVISKAAQDVLNERQRQIDVEGWDAEHDDEHTLGELPQAAACYAIANTGMGRSVGALWPKEWDWGWFKPGEQRKNLVRSGALILAEIERLDRIEAAQPARGKP